MVLTIRLCKNYKPSGERKRNPSPKDCYGSIKISYSKAKTDLIYDGQLVFVCRDCFEKENKEITEKITVME